MTAEEYNLVLDYVREVQRFKNRYNEDGVPIDYSTICTLTRAGWDLIEKIKPIATFSQEPCDDVISRQAVLNVMRENHRSGGRDVDGDYTEGDYRESLYDDIVSLPPVNTTEKVGQWEWIPFDYVPELGNWCCSECKNISVDCVRKDDEKAKPTYKYCPQCGCKIQEVKE